LPLITLLDAAGERPRIAIATEKSGPAVSQRRNKAIAPQRLWRRDGRLARARPHTPNSYAYAVLMKNISKCIKYQYINYL
jgi:hypothetical protein